MFERRLGSVEQRVGGAPFFLLNKGVKQHHLTRGLYDKITHLRPVRLVYKPYFFSQQTIFFSHNKSANSTFIHGLSAKRTEHLWTNNQTSYQTNRQQTMPRGLGLQQPAIPTRARFRTHIHGVG